MGCGGTKNSQTAQASNPNKIQPKQQQEHSIHEAGEYESRESTQKMDHNTFQRVANREDDVQYEDFVLESFHEDMPADFAQPADFSMDLELAEDIKKKLR